MENNINNSDDIYMDQESLETSRPEQNYPRSIQFQRNNQQSTSQLNHGPSVSGVQNDVTNRLPPAVPTSNRPQTCRSTRPRPTRPWPTHPQSNRPQSSIHPPTRPHELSTRPKSSYAANSSLDEESSRPKSMGDKSGKFRNLLRDLKQKLSRISVKKTSPNTGALSEPHPVRRMNRQPISGSFPNHTFPGPPRGRAPPTPVERDTRSVPVQPAVAAEPLVPSNPPEPRVHTTVDFVHCLVPYLAEITASPYYWGVMDRYKAEKLLENKPEGTFLLRDSSQDEFLFSVSFRRYNRSLHARVEQWNHMFSFDCRDESVFKAPSIKKLLAHYDSPNTCMFFEPMLTNPLCRPTTFSLQELSRSVICDNITYDGIDYLPLPRELQEFLRRYHYKQKVRVRTHDDSESSTIVSVVE